MCLPDQTGDTQTHNVNNVDVHLHQYLDPQSDPYIQFSNLGMLGRLYFCNPFRTKLIVNSFNNHHHPYHPYHHYYHNHNNTYDNISICEQSK